MKKILFIFLFMAGYIFASKSQPDIEIRPDGFTNYDGVRYEITESRYLYEAKRLKLILDKEVGPKYADITVIRSSGEPIIFVYLDKVLNEGKVIYYIDFREELIANSEVHIYTSKYQDIRLRLDQLDLVEEKTEGVKEGKE